MPHRSRYGQPKSYQDLHLLSETETVSPGNHCLGGLLPQLIPGHLGRLEQCECRFLINDATAIPKWGLPWLPSHTHTHPRTHVHARTHTHTNRCGHTQLFYFIISWIRDMFTHAYLTPLSSTDTWCYVNYCWDVCSWCRNFVWLALLWIMIFIWCEFLLL